MKKNANQTLVKKIAALMATLAISTGCNESPTRNTNSTSAQIELLKRENETLKAQIASSQESVSKLNAENMPSATEAQASTTATTEESKPANDTSISNPTTKTERFSYAVGTQIGGDFANKEIEIDFGQFSKGVKAAYQSKDNLMTEDESKQVLDEVWKEYQERERAKRSAAGEAAKKEGTNYLTTNKKKPGVKVTASGLQYRVIKAGKGASPTKSDKAEVHYRGWTLDGNEFDSSYSRNKPSTFALTRVIPGWTEALVLMKPGAKWEIIVPFNLAYGPGGKRPKIPPYSTLRFEIELISFEQPQPPAPKKPVTSNIVRIPSQAELNKGAKPEILTKEQEAELKKKNK